MIADMLFELALLVFFFLLLGVGLTIYEFKCFVLEADNERDKKENHSMNEDIS